MTCDCLRGIHDGARCIGDEYGGISSDNLPVFSSNEARLDLAGWPEERTPSSRLIYATAHIKQDLNGGSCGLGTGSLDAAKASWYRGFPFPTAGNCLSIGNDPSGLEGSGN